MNLPPIHLRTAIVAVVVILASALFVLFEQDSRAEDKAFQPENFMLSDFTFVRPSSWEWVPVKVKQKDATFFRVVDVTTQTTGSVWCIYYQPSDGLGHSGLTRWRDRFEKQPPPNITTNRVQIGTHQVTFVDGAGIRSGTPKREAVKPNYALMGAIVEDEKGNVLFRLDGPIPAVEKAKADFKGMVEGGLRTGN